MSTIRDTLYKSKVVVLRRDTINARAAMNPDQKPHRCQRRGGASWIDRWCSKEHRLVMLYQKHGRGGAAAGIALFEHACHWWRGSEKGFKEGRKGRMGGRSVASNAAISRNRERRVVTMTLIDGLFERQYTRTDIYRYLLPLQSCQNCPCRRDSSSSRLICHLRPSCTALEKSSMSDCGEG